MSVTLHTSHGDLKFELYGDLCPKACILDLNIYFLTLFNFIGKNFLALSAKGYYDKTKFHRNIKGFII